MRDRCSMHRGSAGATFSSVTRSADGVQASRVGGERSDRLRARPALVDDRQDSRAVNNFAYVSVSDGVGVGIVDKGEVLRGEHHTAGELGHVSLDPNGPLCACGQRGCWEAFACNSATVGALCRRGVRARGG